MSARVTAERMLLVDELTLSGDDGVGWIMLTRPVLIPAGARYWVDGSDLVVEHPAGSVRRIPGERPGYPRQVAAELRTFNAMITGDIGTYAQRASVIASDRAEAQAKLEAEFGVGTVSDLHDEEAARRRR